MTRTRLSIRLLAEILLIVGVAQAAATLVLPSLGTGYAPAAQTLLGVLLALLLAAPTLYWRCLSLPRSERPPIRPAVPPTRGASVGFAVAMTAGAQALGLALTAASALAVSRDIDASARERFDRGVERIEAEVSRHFSLPLYGLNGLRGLYAARGTVSQGEFRAWVETRNLPVEFPGVRGFGFAERIPAASPGGNGDRYVIKYSEPGPANAVAIGRDAVRDAPRREANERAVRTGLPTLSAPITLTLDGQPTAGFVYLLPVYRGGEPLDPTEREARLTGVLYTPIIAKDILHGVTDVADGALDLQLFDGDQEWTGGGHLVFDGVPPAATAPARPLLQTVRIIDVGGRTLSLRVSSNPAFDASIDRSGVAFVALGGSFGSVLLALTVWLLAIGRARAQRRAERMTADLAQMADRLTLAIEGGSDGLCDWLDVSADAQWWSPSFHALLGLNPAAAEASQSRFVSLLHPDHVAAHAQATADALAGGQPLDRELLLRTGAAGYRWFRWRAKVHAHADGRTLRMAGSLQDIHERKQAEQALRDSEAFLDRAGRIAGVGGWRVDLATRRITWTDQTCRLHDLAPGHRPTFQEALTFYTPEARPQMESAVADCIAHGSPWDLELPLVTAAGRPIWVRAVGEAEFEDGQPVRLIGAFQDVTERRALDAELRRGHELMAVILQNLPCGLSVFDHELRLVAHNPQCQQLLDLPESLLRTPGIRFDALVRYNAERGEHGSDAVETTVERIVANARRPVVQTFERLPTLGVPLEVRRAPMPGGGFVTTYTDISTRKRAEIMLTAALARAEQASVTKSQFLANMSHEIRTPMNAILGMLGLLQRTPLTARQADYAAKSAGAARALLRLLNDILDFSKADAGKMTLDPRPFRIEQLLRDVAVVLSASLGAKAIDLRYDIDPAVPAVLLGDDLRLQQVLINLGGNAIKFTAEGQVVLGLRVLEHTPHDVHLRVALQDSGIGIAPEHQAHIFTGFSQAEASTTRRFGGTGLGLAICQRVVRLMGGELQVESLPGAGSTFHFDLRLPLAEMPNDALAADPPTAPDPAARLRPLAGLRLLLVEDNRDNQQVAQELLSAEGAAVTLADNGQLGVAAVAAADPPFDAVLMDVQMPVMDGHTATAQIRQRLGLRSLPIIAMTANVMASDREACLAAGMNEHIGKPFDLAQLVAVLLRHTGRSTPDPGLRPAAEALPAGLLDDARERGIELATALGRMGGNRQAYLRAMTAFADDVATLPDRLAALLGAGRSGDAGRLMHTLRGLAATLGLQPLARVAADAERQFGPAPTPSDAGALLDRLGALVASTLRDVTHIAAALRATLGEPAVAPATPAPDLARLRRSLDELATLLRSADMRALEVFDHLQQGQTAAWGDLLQPLDAALTVLDFDRALAHCNSLTARLTE